MAMWEQILLGIAALILVFMFWPGARAAMEQSKKAENSDWKGVLIPLGVVVLFLFLLVIVARG